MRDHSGLRKTSAPRFGRNPHSPVSTLTEEEGFTQEVSLQVCASGGVTKNAVVLDALADVAIAMCESSHDGKRLQNKGCSSPGKPKQSFTQKASAPLQATKFQKVGTPKNQPN